MRLALIIFMIGIFLIVAGYVNQVSPQCKEGVEIRLVSRSVYDEIVQNSTLGY